MREASLKGEKEALYANKSIWDSKQHTDDGFERNVDKAKNHQGEGNTHSGEAWKNHGNGKRFEGKCHDGWKKGHMAKGYWTKKKMMENKVATFNTKEKSEDD